MNAVRSVYTDLPARIDIPVQFRHKRAEVIIIEIDDVEAGDFDDFYGSMPDFPDRPAQPSAESRESL